MTFVITTDIQPHPANNKKKQFFTDLIFLRAPSDGVGFKLEAAR